MNTLLTRSQVVKGQHMTIQLFEKIRLYDDIYFLCFILYEPVLLTVVCLRVFLVSNE